MQVEYGLLSGFSGRRDQIHALGFQRSFYGTTYPNHGSHKLATEGRWSVPEIYHVSSWND